MTSSYLRHLPAVYWGEDPPPPEFSLGTFLAAFEKILTGIDDEHVVAHRVDDEEPHTHPSISEVIAGVPGLFDPLRAPQVFLPWLASLVGLEFPTLGEAELWDEYQQRKAIAEIGGIHRRRGWKAGLERYLDLYSVSGTRPRVSIDDGSKLLVTRPLAVGLAPISALVSHGPTVTQPIRNDSKIVMPGLVLPSCIATGADGTLFIGDFGAKMTVEGLTSRVWRLDSAGDPLDVSFEGTGPAPRPVAPKTPFEAVSSLAVRPAHNEIPETLFVLDPQSPRALLFLDPRSIADEANALTPRPPVIEPVAIAVDHNRNILVLDRGTTIGEGKAKTKVVTLAGDPPVVVATNMLPTVAEPLSLLCGPGDTLIIGEGQLSTDTVHAGNLLLIDRSDPEAWQPNPLLPDERDHNPLVAPAAIVSAPNGLYVLDPGLRPLKTNDDVFLRTVAEPACVYLVEGFDSTTTGPTSIRRVTQFGNLVVPTSMAFYDGRLIICDPGQLGTPTQTPVLARLSPFRFNVVIHFDRQRLPRDESDRSNTVLDVVERVRQIVDDLKPAHTLADLVTEG